MISRPRGPDGSSVRLRLLRFICKNRAPSRGSPSGVRPRGMSVRSSRPSRFSIRMTSAPRSPSSAAQNGPAMYRPKSATRRPSRGKVMSYSPGPGKTAGLKEREYTGRSENSMTPQDAFASLNRMAGIAPLRTPGFEGEDPVAPTPLRVGTAAAAALTLAASAANEIWRLRGGSQQDIVIDLKAAAASLVSFALLKLNGEHVPRAALDKPTVGFYRGACGRWIHLQGSFPHLERRTLDLLNADNTGEAIAESVSKWSVLALEDALAYMGQCGAVVRTEEEWKQTAQGEVLSGVPPIVLKKISDAPVLRLPDSESPLDSVRVLDLTRVLAGPVVARTLAGHGAE